ncbi:putative MT-associated protein TORTIFOLIA1/SPIRAL2 [Medicago truncatula]|uniref:Microtubule-associated TORTIFOLIA-like protein n=1 Tax=Medicago truncatula TaxID=3880 RepID=A0A072UCW5_MEDTR|nr:TORTIFOLIA1-like protein 2 [Medicago truncatula]KEH27286.1 microtubule-associated TORTIFOLIA-like protein [Medicago truncatula]RHN53196.1 putative MT-associated protein TORTIFOLIA1/SPIRAL2 [Medicago truncatula]
MKTNNKLSSNFEMKQRVHNALNKVGDRDTHDIGTKELETILHSLTPHSISPFLSCILDIHSELKPSIRKQSLKLIASLATVYESLILPHLTKIVASVVKCFRDPDSSVREGCVEIFSVLALKLANQGNEDKVFVLLSSPIFDALVGEQNKHVQSASAFCLAGIVQNTRNPPVSVLYGMLIRILKLLKNPHFMAKPALIELNRCIIQAGGASTQSVLLTAVGSIREGLNDTDWKTRKAASVALGQIALTRASFLSSLRASCIHSLDSSRFDKVKPVRDAVLQALKYWKMLPGHYTTEPSETGSSLKENICGGDSVDLSSTTTTESRHRDVRLQKVNMKSTTGRIPLSVRKACQNDVGHLRHPKTDDWHVEVAVPRTHSVVEFHTEEFEASSVTKPLITMSADVTSMQGVGYEYGPMDDKQECSSVSNYETKFLTSHDCFVNNGPQKPNGRSQRLDEGISCNEQIDSIKMQDPKSSDSTVTESSPQITHQCCLQRANEMTCIRNQLSDIEIKQENMMHQLQIFTTGIMDALSTIQSRMLGLENVVDRLSRESLKGGRHSFSENSKFVRQSQNVASPRISVCTPKPSSESSTKQSGLFLVKSSESLEKRSFSRSQPRIHAGDSVDMCKSYKVKTAPKVREDNLNSLGEDRQSTCSAQVRKNGSIFSSAAKTNARNGCPESNTNYWKCVNRLVCEGDLNSAYMEALCSGDELILIELLNKTGPVIESLSGKTVNVLLSTLAPYLLEGKFFNTIIPWLQQVVEMSTVHGPNCIALSIEVEEQLLYAIQEVVNLNIFSHAEKRRAAELAIKLHHIWSKINES